MQDHGITATCGHGCKVMVVDDYWTHYLITGVIVQFVSHRRMYGCNLSEQLLPVIQFDEGNVKPYAKANPYGAIS